jgi:arginase family enzyme
VVAFDIAEYDPQRDPGGTHARKVVDIIVRAVTRRLR